MFRALDAEASTVTSVEAPAGDLARLKAMAEAAAQVRRHHGRGVRHSRLSSVLPYP